MSEHIPHSPEHEKQPQHHEAAEHLEHAKHEKAPEAFEHERQDMLEQAQKTIEKEAVSQHELPIEEKHEVPNKQFVGDELRAMSINRTMSRTRKKLSKPEQSLSKVVHQPVVDGLSRAGEKTISRPSGLLAGGICALIGSSIMLYMSKHYGFRYNLFVFIALFVGGFVLGLLLELVFRVGRRSKVSS